MSIMYFDLSNLPAIRFASNVEVYLVVYLLSKHAMDREEFTDLDNLVRNITNNSSTYHPVSPHTYTYMLPCHLSPSLSLSLS